MNKNSITLPLVTLQKFIGRCSWLRQTTTVNSCCNSMQQVTPKSVHSSVNKSTGRIGNENDNHNRVLLSANMRRSQLSIRGTNPMMTFLLLLSMVVILSCSPTFVTSSNIIDPDSTLECHRREFSYRVFRADSLGRKCWDYITVMSCWGRCDSNEVADWQFPYKLPFHPVCIHDERILKTTELTNCEPEVEIGTNIYEYYEAVTCACQTCQSSFANCEGLHYRGDTLI